MKSCNRCGEEKLLTEFFNDGKQKDGKYRACKICHSKATALWKQNNPDKHRVIIKEDNYKRRYGLSIQQKQEMIDKQRSKCAICESDLGTTHNVCVDHCHETNKIRGILCRKCNLGIGHLNDSVTILKNAVKYLNKHKKEKVN